MRKMKIVINMIKRVVHVPPIYFPFTSLTLQHANVANEKNECENEKK